MPVFAPRPRGSQHLLCASQAPEGAPPDVWRQLLETCQGDDRTVESGGGSDAPSDAMATPWEGEEADEEAEWSE